MTAIRYLDLLRCAAPEAMLAATALVVLAVDLLATRGRAARVRWNAGIGVALAGLAATLYLLLASSGSVRLLGGMLLSDPQTRIVQASLVLLTALSALFASGAEFTAHAGEYLCLILLAAAATVFLAGTENLLLIFIALELLSLCLYVLTAFDKGRRQSAEAALKYFLFGGMSAAFLLFGVSLLYGLTGAIDLAGVAQSLRGEPMNPMLPVAVAMILTGFGFKVAAAPFHLWAPDVYQGAPAPSAAYIASCSKVAGFFVLVRVLETGLSAWPWGGLWREHAAVWAPMAAAMAVLSMLVGNLAAIAQSSVRRLLAYSAVGHAGYMLLGLLSQTQRGVAALLYYVMTYALAAAGCFGVLAAIEAGGRGEQLDGPRTVDATTDLAGLSKRSPALAACLLVFLLSLAGIPPLAGFFGKFYLFTAFYTAWTGAPGGEPAAGALGLVALAIAASAVSLYYYLKVLKQVYVLPPAAELDGEHSSASGLPIRPPLALQAALALAAAAVVLLGCAPQFLMDWLQRIS